MTALFDRLGLALERIRKSDGVEASVTKKAKGLNKWGYLDSTALNTWETVQTEGGTEALLTTNAISHIDSTAAGDTWTVVVQGHYLSADDDLVWHSQSVVMTGITAVQLTQPLARCSRMYISVGNDVAVGTITVNAGEGGTVYNTIVVGDSQTEKAATSVSYKDYLIVTDFGSSMVGNSNSAVRFRLERKTTTGPWRPVARWALKGGAEINYERHLDTPLILGPNSDIRLRCEATGVSSVEGHFGGTFAVDEQYLSDYTGTEYADGDPA